MKKIIFLFIFSIILASSVFAQFNLNAKFGSGVTSFYKIRLQQTIEDDFKYLPSSINRLGVGIGYKYNTSKNVSIDVFLDHNYYRKKTLIKDSILWITNDTSYYLYDDLYEKFNLFRIYIPVLFYHSFSDKFSIGAGVTNHLTLNKTAISNLTGLNVFSYQLGVSLSFKYLLYRRLGVLFDIQNEILPFGAYSSNFNPYLVNRGFVSLGFMFEIL